MPLPRIWKARRWFAAHPPAAACVRTYLGIKDPEPRSAAPVAPATEDEVFAIGSALGMRG